MFNACSDDDDKKYTWENKWTHTFKRIPDGSIIRIDKMFEGKQNLSEEDATIGINFNPAMLITVKDKQGNSLIISDEIQDTHELKLRKLIAYSSFIDNDTIVLERDTIINNIPIMKGDTLIRPDTVPTVCTLELLMQYKLVE